VSAEDKRIEEVLGRVRACISSGLITYEMNGKERCKNEAFTRKYRIHSKERNKILTELTSKDFCESILDRLKNEPKYDEILYVFGIEKELEERETGIQKKVPIYIKLQFFKMEGADEDVTLVISFHEAEKPLRFMFR